MDMRVFRRITPDNLHGAVGGTAVYDDVLGVRTILLDHVPDAELDEAAPVEDGRYDGKLARF